VHRQSLLPDLLATRLDLGRDVPAGAADQRPAEPVAAEAVHAQKGNRAALDQAREALELVAALVEADRRGAQGEEGRDAEGDGDDGAEDVERPLRGNAAPPPLPAWGEQ